MSNQDNRQHRAESSSTREETFPGDRSQLANHLGPDTEHDQATLAGTLLAGETAAAPDNDDREWHIEVGSDVIGECGHKVGEVVAVRDDVIVVEKGFFMPEDFYIPKAAIQRNDEHGLYLNVTKNDALHRGWNRDPRLTKAG